MSETRDRTMVVLKWTYGTFTVLICVWICAWIVKVYLDASFGWIATSLGAFVYWIFAKIFIWIFPALLLLRVAGRSLREVFNLRNWRGWLAWGGGVGVLISLTGFIPSLVRGSPLFATQFDVPLLSVLTVAPMFEEFLMRGAVFWNLQQVHSTAVANVVSSLMFIVLHIPGWYFMGTLMENLTRPIGGALSIFLLGLAFGYATHRGRSVVAGMLAHFLNNLV